MAEFQFGYIDLEEMASRRVTEVGVEVIAEANSRSAELWSAEAQANLAHLCRQTTSFKLNHRLPGDRRMQAMTRKDVPVPQTEAQSYDQSIPLRIVGDAWGADRLTLEGMSVEEAADEMNGILRADAKFLQESIVKAILDNGTYTFYDEAHNDLSIKPLANNDSRKYLKTNGNLVTANMYAGQAAAISDAAQPFTTMKNTLRDFDANAGAEFTAYIAENLEATVEGLSDFISIDTIDPDVAFGANQNTLRNGRGTSPIGRVIGKFDGVWIHTWSALPDNYTVTEAGKPFLHWRYEPLEPGLFDLGWFNVNEVMRRHGFRRHAGFAAANPVGCMVYQIGSGSYSVPSGYDHDA